MEEVVYAYMIGQLVTSLLCALVAFGVLTALHVPAAVPLAVLIAVIVGGSLQGVLGAILVLPLVAAYPVIERIWLRDTLDPETVSDHRELARAAEADDGDETVDAVLRGSGPAPAPQSEKPARRRAGGRPRAKEAS